MSRTWAVEKRLMIHYTHRRQVASTFQTHPAWHISIISDYFLTPGLLCPGLVPIETSAELADSARLYRHHLTPLILPIAIPDCRRLSWLHWARWRLITSLLFSPPLFSPAPSPLPSENSLSKK